jgi:dipeptidase E
MHHILMLSSSRAGDEPYLAHAEPLITSHLAAAQTTIDNIVFVPYAGVTMSNTAYTEKVKQALPSMNISGIESYASPQQAIEQADAVFVGGGNTFHLLHCLYANGLIPALRAKVDKGMPYVGWSAGSNICGQTIRTTNDMPIIEPESFNALDFVPFQLNPHYTDYQPPNHNGETRDQRLAEFTTLNPETPVLAIREGTALQKCGESLTLLGNLSGFVFLGQDKQPIHAGDDLSQWLI